MLIKKFNVPEPPNGLKSIKLERLGNLVVLIGKNGSGKTRVLNLIEDYLTNTLSEKEILNGSIEGAPTIINKLAEEIQAYNTYSALLVDSQEVGRQRQTRPNDKALNERQRQLRAELKALQPQLSQSNLGFDVVKTKIEELNTRLQNEIQKIRKNYVKRIKFSEIKELKDSISESTDENQSFESLIETVTENLEYNELGVISASSLNYLKKLPNQLVYDWMDCKGDTKKLEKRVSFSRFKSLSEIFNQIFGKQLQWEINTINSNITDQGLNALILGLWTINGREFNFEEFSDGEKTLFIYVLLFFLLSQNAGIRLKQSILIIDEPELHLHADAEIELLNSIRKIIGEDGQLWIATHSINILSHVNYDEVFVVKDNIILRPSKTIQREALTELFTIQHRVEKLSEFLTSITEWTYVNFMIECFTNPDVIETAHNTDPQIAAFKEILKMNSGSKKSLLLDFGAGKGRLSEQALDEQSLTERFEYCALEPNTSFHEKLSQKGIAKIYSKYSELQNNYFDFIVLCNVLHEITIDEWIPTINKIIDSLTENGFLIILEAKILTKGEFIRKAGFLLLDEAEISKLFSLGTSLESIKLQTKTENITCVVIEKQKLKPLTQNQLIETLDTLENNAYDKVKDLKAKHPSDIEINNKYGRQLAFLSQLYINARLAKEMLRQPKAKFNATKVDEMTISN
ncbi:MAG: AAA family ATPase [Ferruginibacter sp.]